MSSPMFRILQVVIQILKSLRFFPLELSENFEMV